MVPAAMVVLEIVFILCVVMVEVVGGVGVSVFELSRLRARTYARRVRHLG